MTTTCGTCNHKDVCEWTIHPLTKTIKCTDWQAVRNTGYWISTPNEFGEPHLRCSECNENYYPSYTRPTYPFCPWCGADMNGGTIK